MEKIEHCIYIAKATKYRPQGYKVVKFVTDQYGDRRCIQQIFRGRGALDKARRCRDEIEADKKRGRYFKEPVRKVDHVDRAAKQLTTNPDFSALFALGEALAKSQAAQPEPEEEKTLTLREYMELGLRESIDGEFTIDPKSDERGWLRRKIEETNRNNWVGKVGTWKIIRDSFGQIHDLTVDEITGQQVDDFVRWMETATNKHNKPYRVETIKYYRADLTAMIKNYAAHCGVINPLERTPPSKKPSRIKGEEETVKVPLPEEVKELEDGFKALIENTEDRYHHLRVWAWHIHQVMRDTGCRPGEVLALTESSIDRERMNLIISHAVANRKVGLTKTGKAKGSRKAGTRIVPITSETLAVIDNWVRVRAEHGYAESELIFANPKGEVASDDGVRKSYKATGSSLTPYQMRHWRNDQLRRQGVPIEIRKAAMGHLSDEINSNYTHVNPEELRKYLTGD